MKPERPNMTEVPDFYKNYIKIVPENNVLEVLEKHLIDIPRFFKNIPGEKLAVPYAPGKWTIKDILLHLIDSERVMSYRALSFARKDKTMLPGFEQDDYVKNAGALGRDMSAMIREFEQQRMSTIALFKSFDDDMLQQTGEANNSVLSVLMLAFIIAGHEIHHVTFIKNNYL